VDADGNGAFLRRECVPVTRFVLLFGECDPELLGVYELAEDGRLAAESHAGHGLAWAHVASGLRSADYRVVGVPYHDHEAFRTRWNAENLRTLMEASEEP
jgi:hypothetical protein